MKTRTWLLSLTVFCALAALTTPAATNYVWQGSPSPASPYTNWATAAHTIQEAMDAANTGDLVLVTNGVYATGGRAVFGLMTNRVAVDKPLILSSVNGPEVTVIQGYQVPGTTNGDGAIRCVYLTNGAVLFGFTLTNGATLNFGDFYRECSGGGVWCESTNVVVTNCILTGNSAGDYGGGGGAFSGTLNHCTLTANSASYIGGGAFASTLNNCTLTGNSSASDGGGAYESTLNNCLLTGNAAPLYGGGACDGTLNNCTLTGNSAGLGGGACASDEGDCYLNNCILYYNNNNYDTAYDNYSYDSTLNYSCTTPMPTNGFGNITNEPAFVNAAAGNFHLRYGSPCIDTGTNLSAIITDDLDGHPRPRDGNGDGIAMFDIGAYECVPLARYVWQDSPTPAPPYTDWASAAHTIQEAVDTANTGDLVLVTNGVYSSGGKAVYGTMTNRVAVDKPLILISVNGPTNTIIQGYQVPETTNGDGAIRCVYLTNGASLFGFTLSNGATRDWPGDAYLEACGGGVWCEFAAGVVSNCVLVGNSAASHGGGACGGTLNYCTLRYNSAPDGWGGGASGSTLNNSAVVGNSAWQGGGAFESTLSDCTLTGNLARDLGGGAYGCTLKTCTVAGNSIGVGSGLEYGGGGTYGGTLRNSIVHFNTAPNGANYLGTEMDYCSTTPMPNYGFGNITNEPAFVDRVNGNLRLQSNSPCINAGNDSYVTTATDLDGNPRIINGTVDLGAYEYQGAGSVISYAWLQQYGLTNDGSVDTIDRDGDGLNTTQEWMADSNPNDAASGLRLTILSNTPPVAVTFYSSAARRYTLLCGTNLTPSSIWTPVPGLADMLGTGDALTLSDTNPPAPAFYRVSVRFP